VLLDQCLIVAVEVQTLDDGLERRAEDILLQTLFLRLVQQHVVALAPQCGDAGRLRDDGQRVNGLQQKRGIFGLHDQWLSAAAHAACRLGVSAGSGRVTEAWAGHERTLNDR